MKMPSAIHSTTSWIKKNIKLIIAATLFTLTFFFIFLFITSSEKRTTQQPVQIDKKKLPSTKATLSPQEEVINLIIKQTSPMIWTYPKKDTASYNQNKKGDSTTITGISISSTIDKKNDDKISPAVQKDGTIEKQLLSNGWIRDSNNGGSGISGKWHTITVFTKTVGQHTEVLSFRIGNTPTIFYGAMPISSTK